MQDLINALVLVDPCHIKFNELVDFFQRGECFPEQVFKLHLQIGGPEDNQRFEHLFFGTKVIGNHRDINFCLLGNVSDGSAVETFFCKKFFCNLKDTYLLVVKVQGHFSVKNNAVQN